MIKREEHLETKMMNEHDSIGTEYDDVVTRHNAIVEEAQRCYRGYADM